MILNFFYDKPILPQVHELQVIVNKLSVVKIKILESFQVGAIIAKLPSTWKGYRKKILHSSKDFSLEQIQKHLRIEEESRARDKNENSYEAISKANVVTKPSQTNKNKNLGPKKDQDKFKKTQVNKKSKRACFVCGKAGHYVRDCRYKKKPSDELR